MEGSGCNRKACFIGNRMSRRSLPRAKPNGLDMTNTQQIIVIGIIDVLLFGDLLFSEIP